MYEIQTQAEEYDVDKKEKENTKGMRAMENTRKMKE
jgi:hypothetical protein